MPVISTLRRKPALICQENGALQKQSSNQRTLKTLAMCFSVGKKHFENGAFQKCINLSR